MAPRKWSRRRVLLEVDQPQFNHDGGAVVFGPDGFLYVSLGDGGGANDVGLGHPPIGNGQDRTTLLGSILRLDVDGAEPYGIPEDNPFVGEEGRDEIFAYGFRNPFRMSFDQGGDRELFVGDVGQNRWEEVDRVTLGANYGWNIKEGTHCFDPDNPEESPESCPDVGPQGSPLVDPILEYKNANAEDGIGLAVVGGFVYRGSDIPGLAGEYVFGDWSASFSEPRGKIFAAPLDDGEERLFEMRELSIGAEPNGELGSFLLALGQDARGEMYALGTQNTGPTGTTGRVYRLTQADTPEPRPDAGVGDAGPGGDADVDGDAGQALAQQLSRGQTVFANNCSTCHGDDGMGTALGPALRVKVLIRTAAVKLSAITCRRMSPG